MILYKTLILCLISALWSCTQTFDDLDEFETYIKSDKSPYVQSITKNGVKVSLRYIPTDAMMINSYRQYMKKQEKLLADSLLSKEQKAVKLNDIINDLQKRKDSYSHSIYFHLTMGYEDDRDIVYERMQSSGYGVYSQWIQKLMFKLEDYIYLQTPSIDEIPIDTYHMERTFGMRKSRTFLLMFPVRFNDQDLLDGGEEKLKFVIKEFGLNVGKITFEYNLPFEEVTYRGR